MKHKWRRSMALILVLAMCLSLLQVQVLATEAETVDEQNINDSVNAVEDDVAVAVCEASADDFVELAEEQFTEDSEESIENGIAVDEEAIEGIVEIQGEIFEEQTEDEIGINELEMETETIAEEKEAAFTALESSDESEKFIVASGTYGSNLRWELDEETDDTNTPSESDVVNGTCGENLIWTLKDGILTISGTGAMEDYSDLGTQPWYDYSDSIVSIIIENGVTSIGVLAFEGCHSLNCVEIGDSVTSIGMGSFAYCSSVLY